MKKLIFIAGLYLISITGFAQSNERQIVTNGLGQLLFVNNSEQAIQLAKQDILDGRPFLLMQSGLISSTYANNKEFETKYKVAYYDFGCMGPEKSFLQEYNKVIFQYLTEKYGKEWLKEARQDIVGMKDLSGC